MSVALQTYRPIQHVVVSDGPNPELRELLHTTSGERPAAGYELTLDFLPEHSLTARWGHFARLRGQELAKGDLIAYLDDDDELYPQHVEYLTDALLEAGADFSYSRILIHDVGNSWVSGAEPPRFGHISTSSILHRRKLLDTATWRDEGQLTIDWDLAERWMAGGASWAFHPQITAAAHRDAPNVQSDRPRNLRKKEA